MNACSEFFSALGLRIQQLATRRLQSCRGGYSGAKYLVLEYL
jgi:hypothetical protein